MFLPILDAPLARLAPRRGGAINIQSVITRGLFFSFALALLAIRGDALAQYREDIAHDRVNRIQEPDPFGANTNRSLGALRGHSREQLQFVDEIGEAETSQGKDPSEPSWLSDPSGVGGGVSNGSTHAGVRTGTTSRGSAYLRGPITQDPCSKAITFVSNIDIDTDGRGNTVPTRTELPETSFQSRGQSLNSDKVNFIVMPGNCGEYLGRYASVTYRGETVYGIVGDCGPAGKTGEVSTAMAKELSDKLHSKGKGQGVPRFTGDGDRDHFKGFAEDGAVYTIYSQGVSRSTSISSAHINTGAREAESIAAGCAQKRRNSSLSDSMRF